MEELIIPTPEIFYEKNCNGYFSRCPGFEDCETNGKTIEEVTNKTMIKITEVLKLLVYIKFIAETKKTNAIAILLKLKKSNPNSSVRNLSMQAIIKITKQIFK